MSLILTLGGVQVSGTEGVPQKLPLGVPGLSRLVGSRCSPSGPAVLRPPAVDVPAPCSTGLD